MTAEYDNRCRPTLTPSERLFLINQYEIMLLNTKGVTNKKDLTEKIEILYNGYQFEYDRIFGSIHEELTTAECTFVLNVFSMFEVIQRSFEALSATDKKLVSSHSVLFPGFSGNEESQLLGYARYVKKDRFTSVQVENEDLNSHMPVVSAYERMLKSSRKLGQSLNLTQLQSVLSEWVHPNNR